jgi:hypothetical protein
MKQLPKSSGFTLLETLTAVAITMVILGSVTASTIALQRSFLGNRAYTKSINDSQRVADYIARDLRSAMAISRRTNNVSTPFKISIFDIAANDELCIFVPNYYDSNNSGSSEYREPHFARENIDTASGKTYFDYDDVVQIIGVTRFPKYPGTPLEIRYSKRARSATDPTICYFRTEFEGGIARQTEEIAENAEGLNVRIRGRQLKEFQIITSFSSKWSGEKYRDGSRQFTSVFLENFRTDTLL